MTRTRIMWDQETPKLPPLAGLAIVNAARPSVCKSPPVAEREIISNATGSGDVDEEDRGRSLEFVTCAKCGLPFIVRCERSSETMMPINRVSRSWPSQSRQSTLTPGVWQQTAHPRNNKVYPSPSRQVQSQTTHRHIASLGLRRSKTCADFAFTGQTGQAYRTTGDSSVGTLPKVQGTWEGTTFNASSNGLLDRASALKSLANNPHLQVETINGTTRIFRTRDRRPRSLPAKFSESPLSENTLPPDHAEPQKVIYVSKHGYHPRSKSPTYPILIGTKDTLNLALCKKLWRIRRDLEGRKARENSIVYSEISQAMVDDKETEQWYEKMFDEHEQDDDEEDRDMAAIESLRLANPDGEFAQLDESISTVHPRPQMDLLFDRKYLKEHINDWTILGIDIEEEELKTEQRLKTASVARPTSASRKPRVPMQTEIKAKVSHRQTVALNRSNKPGRTKREQGATVTKLPAVPSTGRVFHARDNRKRRGKKTKKPNLAIQSEEEVLPDLTTGDLDTRTPSPTLDPEPELEPTVELGTTDDLEMDDMERRKSLISKYLRSPKPDENPSLVPAEPEDTPAEDRDETKSQNQEEEEEKPKELTEKEKFILMRKRMDERKAKMQKRREDFLDYSMLGIRSQRRRNGGDPAAPSSTKNSLGSLMSTRLESMATFKTRKYQGEEVDEDEDDDNDDDEEDEGDGEDVDEGEESEDDS